MSVSRSTHRGFTLLEVAIVLGVVAVLAAVALPTYDAHVKRGHILDAVTKLAHARARMDDYFFDQRAYVDGAGQCGVAAASGATDYFTLRCEATATAYLYTATGIAAKGMGAFVYTIDQAGARTTVSVPAGWLRMPDCWTIRQDGFCV